MLAFIDKQKASTFCEVQAYKLECQIFKHHCADDPQIGLSMSLVFSSLGMKLAQTGVAKNER